MSAPQQPVAFEVEIKKSPAKVTPIKMRLELQSNCEASAPSLKDIEEKLKKAEEKRKTQERQFTPESLKVEQVLSRKQRMEQEAEQLIKSKISAKQKTAEELRSNQIHCRVRKARL